MHPFFILQNGAHTLSVYKDLQSVFGIDSAASVLPATKALLQKDTQGLAHKFCLQNLTKLSGKQVLLTKRSSTHALLAKRSGNQGLVTIV